MGKNILRNIGICVLGMFFAVSAANAKTLAKVGNEKISLEEFQKAVDSQAARNKKELTKEQKNALLQTMINQRLLISETKKRDLHEEDPLKSILEARERELLAQAVFELEVLQKVSVTPEEIENFFDKNPKIFNTVQARQILVQPKSADEGDKKVALKEAEKLKKKATRKNFAQLAKKHSADTLTRDKGGSLGLLRPGMLLPALDKAVFENKKKFIGPVETRFGYHVIYVEKRHKETFAEAKELISKELQNAKKGKLQEALIKKLKEKYKVKIKEDLIP